MAFSDSTGNNKTSSTLCEDSCMELEMHDKLEADKSETVDNVELLGKVIKEGTINVQDNLEWVQCHIVVREHSLTLTYQTTNENPQKKTAVNVVITFSSSKEVDIVMLPDNARRSRESKLFPFAVQKKTAVEETSTQPKEFISGGARQAINRDKVILATSNGREMWEWATCIQWLGTTPKEEEIPYIRTPMTIRDHNEHYEDAEVLQTALLKMFTYKNLPTKPVSVLNAYLHRRYTETGDDSDSKIIENNVGAFRQFIYSVLVGTCVHVNEKCFELITSTALYDIPSLKTHSGNTPLSMLCEGDYNSSRNFIVQALWSLGHPTLEGYYASGHQSFSILLAKPQFLTGAGNVLGQPVHPDDQKLCRYLRDEGDGRIDNKELSNKLIEASLKESPTFAANHMCRITGVIIPKSVIPWGRTTLTHLDLSVNGIIELPDELYEFSSLTHLNLAYNCLFGLSHKLGNLTKLTDFNIRYNLIEELPYTIEKLDQISTFNCSHNPITKPISSVWSRGITEVRSYFRDMRESGMEINVDLRVLVLGLSEAGKTSLINGLINPDARALTRVGDRTVGIEKRTWTMERDVSEARAMETDESERSVNLLTYDFAGQEEYYITHHLFLGSKALYIVAFDLSVYEPETLDKQVMLWWDSIQNRVCDIKSNDSKTPKIILVGTHADMVDDAQSRADDIHKSLTERFQSHGKDLDDRLKELEDELKNLDPRRKIETLEEAKRMNTKLIDRTDKAAMQAKEEYVMLPASKKAKILSIESGINKIHHERQCTIALPTAIQAVSSKDLRNFRALREQILFSLTEIGPSGKYFPHLDVPVPNSWLQVRTFVRQQSTRKDCECMKLPKYFKLLSDELGISMDVGHRATKFCHDLGDVLFFEKEDLVFLQPSFLIDMFKYVIRHDHKESTYWTEKMMLEHNVSEEQFNTGKKLLLEKGELYQWLLEILWSHLYENSAESSITNNFIQLLETFDIGTSIEREGEKIISIPEFQTKTLTINWPRWKEDGHYEIQRWISIDQKLPHGLLKRIQVRILKKVFKRNGAKVLNLAQNEIYIMDENLTELYISSGKRTEECSEFGPVFGTSEGVRMYIRGIDKSCVMSLLSKVYSCIENTLRDYPGLVFDHFVVHTTQTGSLLMKLEEVQAILAAGESKISMPTQIRTDPNGVDIHQKKNDAYHPGSYVNINDLLCSPPYNGA